MKIFIRLYISIHNVPGSFENFNTPKVIDETETYTLTMDLNNTTAKNYFLKYDTPRNFYFRIGALAGISGQGTVRHNYAPSVVIQLP